MYRYSYFLVGPRRLSADRFRGDGASANGYPCGGALYTMPNCRNCESVVTEAYVRVFAPNGMKRPRVCPNCEDKTREKGGVRQKRN